MSKLIGIRREDKNIWERRVPLIPRHVEILKKEHDIQTRLQPFPARAFSDDEYKAIGAEINEDLTPCQTILAVKEIPTPFLIANRTYLFFSHTIKGQSHNMPLLQKMLDLQCTLIDYECIKDDQGRRLVFFGRFAGLAGMIDTLHAFGQRLKGRGLDTPFAQIRPTYEYSGLEEAKKHLREIGDQIKRTGFPALLAPLVVGITGYGHVSQGAQEILDLFPVKEISPKQLFSLKAENPRTLYKVVFKEEHTVQPIDPGHRFDLQDYYQHPEKYRSAFERYVPYLTILVNGIYWDPRYPRLISKKYLRENYWQQNRLQVIGDISCDINGSIECTEKVTESHNPAFVYNPLSDTIVDGFAGNGITVIAVDNLPSELPRDASESFSEALYRFIPEIVNADMTVPFEKCALPPEIKRAVIVYNGELTPDYRYLQEHLG